MSELELDAVSTPVFRCQATLLGSELQVEFVGQADMTAAAPIADYLKRLDAEACRLSIAEVSCDFRQLRFMNSSCFKSFVLWIEVVKNEVRPYRIRFLADRSLSWQRRSLEPLRRLAGDAVSISG